MDSTKFADRVAERFSKGKAPKADPDMDQDAKNEKDEPQKSDKELGRVLAAALRANNFEAITEAVRKICDY